MTIQNTNILVLQFSIILNLMMIFYIIYNIIQIDDKFKECFKTFLLIIIVKPSIIVFCDDSALYLSTKIL